MYYFYLGDIQLPIAPKTLTISYANKNETVDLLQIGEVTIPKPLGLTEYSFEIMLPNSDYPINQSLLMKHKKASFYMKKLEGFKKSMQPIVFTVIRMKPNGEILSKICQRVTVEDLEHKEDHDYGFDAYLSIKLKEWRDYGTKRLIQQVNKDGTVTASPEQTRISDKVPAKQVTSPNGFNKTTLMRLVKKELGDTNNLFKIAALNKITVPCYLGGIQAINMYKEGDVEDLWRNLIKK